MLNGLHGQCDSMDELAELLEKSIDPEPPSHLRDGGVIRNGFNESLDKLRAIAKDGQEHGWREYQQREVQRTGIGAAQNWFQ